jgi:3-deoxy-D-manno-octulosonic-acid transferase
MSRKSYRRWKHVRGTASELLSAFDLCLAQTKEDAESFTKLGMLDVRVRDNLKYAADPLPADPIHLSSLQDAVGDRPVWLFASTHAGEEELACTIHRALREKILNLLTIIVPRHPERGDDIAELCKDAGLRVNQRGQKNSLPWGGDEIYLADTLGELGLFYRLAPVSCIGRTFSLDGGGGHNPIEPAQLGSAVLHGPLIQNQTRLFAEMHESGAALGATTPKELESHLFNLLSNPTALVELRRKGKAFADSKAATLSLVMQDIEPFLADSGILAECKQCA